MGGNVVKRELRPQGANVVAQTPESIHYNLAVTQFTQMLGGQGHTVKSVDWYENPDVEANFEACKRRLANKEEVWVFHGTKKSIGCSHDHDARFLSWR